MQIGLTEDQSMRHSRNPEDYLMLEEALQLLRHNVVTERP